MRVAVLATSSTGKTLTQELSSCLHADAYIKSSAKIEENAWTAAQKLREIWNSYDSFLLIMSVNTAARAIAPLMCGKALDPAVVVVDEEGKFAVSLLSGKMNEANNLAKSAAQITGGIPVITAVTNTINPPLFDEIAAKNGFAFENNENLIYIYNALKDQGQVYLNSQVAIDGDLDESVLELMLLDLLNLPENSPVVLITNLEDKNPDSIYYRILQRHRVFLIRPRNLVLGVQCTADVSAEMYEEKIRSFLISNGFSPLSLKAIAMVNADGQESLVKNFAEKYGADVQAYTMDAVGMVEHMFPQVQRQKSDVASCCCALCAGELPVALENDEMGVSLAATVTKERLIL